MKKIITHSLFACFIAIPLSAKAAYTPDFTSAVPGGGTEGGPTNFGSQLGWSISNPDPELSFVYPGVGLFGQGVALGGYYSTPTTVSTKLFHPLTEAALNNGQGYLNIDFALINADGTTGFVGNDDTFGFSLSDSSGPVLTINFEPTIDENIRSITTITSAGSTPLFPDGIIPSSYASPSYYNLYVDFTANGSDLEFQGRLGGVNLPAFHGTIAGKAGTTFTEFGVNYLVNDTDPLNAGSNFILLGGLSIPEPSVTLTGLMSLGLLSLRRRR